MKNEGWAWGDLVGELMARGIAPESVSNAEVDRVLSCPCVEVAADQIEGSHSR